MTTLDHPLVAFVAVIAAGSVVVRMLLAAVAARHARRRVPALRRAVDVSVLKPLCGVDADLHDNLRSLLRQDYAGTIEVVLGTTDYGDPALGIARALQREFPEFPIRVVVSPAAAAINPKVANLIGLTSVARHDALLVSDANVRLGPTYLSDMVAELEAGAGLVANLVAGTDDGTLPATLENLQLNGFTAAAVCGAWQLGRHPCVIGKSLLMRRRDLEALGGWTAFGGVLGEDYALGQAFARAGLGVRISSHVVAARSTGWTLPRFLERHLRWCQMRRWIAPAAYVLEPLMSPCAWAMALLVCAWSVGALGLAVAAAFGVAAAVAIEAAQARLLRGRWPGPRYLAVVPLKELLMLGVWGWAWFRREVTWRGHTYVIGPGSGLRERDRPVDVDLGEAHPFVPADPRSAASL